MTIQLSKSNSFWFGAIALLLFCVGTFVFALFVPGYSHVKQTVSEIGEEGSPMQIPFTMLLCLIACCLFVFAYGMRQASRELGLSQLTSFFIVCMGISAAGVGIFAFPHPLHNVFGMSEIIGYHAPLVLAITWRRYTGVNVVFWSWIFYGAIVIAMLINMMPLFSTELWSSIKPVQGLAQRFLFISFFLWCAVVGWKLQGVKD